MHLKAFERLTSSNQANHVFLKRRNTMLQNLKANKTTIIPSKISSAYECKPSHSFPDLSSLKFFEHEWTNNTFTKSHSTKNATFSMHLEQFKAHDDNRQTQSNAHFLMPKIKLSFSDFKPIGKTICTPALSSLTYHH